MRQRGSGGLGARLLPLLAAALAAASLGCQSLGRWVTTPPTPFDAVATPPAPDYASPRSWAALPGRESRADALPPHSGAVAAGPDAAADAFFVHPTTWFWRTRWNAPIDGWLTGQITGATLAGQASAFNGAARIYAPRYRQMALSGFQHPEVREPALALAYQDVRRAFLYYLEAYAGDRPLILAGHSQGSRLLLRLLDEFFREGPLRERLVAAYVVGARVWQGPHARGEAAVPVCGDAQQTGCLVSWRSFAEGADPSLDTNPEEPADGETLCVNPLSWRSDAEPVPASANRGAIPLPMWRGPGRPRPAASGARCGDGVLWIEPPSGWGFHWAHEDGNWHAYDYALFYMNVREDAKRRVDAFLRRRAAPDQPAETPQARPALSPEAPR